MEHPEFVRIILSWYKINKRDLPWRKEKDAYKIWLSEILLQQTRVNQGLPYYYSFVTEFPTVSSLALSEEQKVLRLWQGLGYYSRARNLHTTAKNIHDNYNGHFPSTYKELLKLKGVGEYTAAAIASFAFDEKVAVLDGNVFRVISRVFGIDTDIASTEGKKYFTKIANSLLPEYEGGDYNQAIMEFGALQCTPQSPNCSICPLSHLCYAFEHKRQSHLPVKSKLLKKKTRHFNYLVYTHENHVLMQERRQSDIWKGLYQFPLNESDANVLQDGMEEYFPSKMYKHVLSHQIIKAVFWKVTVEAKQDFENLAKQTDSIICNAEEAEQLPKSVLINNYLRENIF